MGDTMLETDENLALPPAKRVRIASPPVTPLQRPGTPADDTDDDLYDTPIKRTSAGPTSEPVAQASQLPPSFSSNAILGSIPGLGLLGSVHDIPSGIIESIESDPTDIKEELGSDVDEEEQKETEDRYQQAPENEITEDRLESPDAASPACIPGLGSFIPHNAKDISGLDSGTQQIGPRVGSPDGVTDQESLDFYGDEPPDKGQHHELDKIVKKSVTSNGSSLGLHKSLKETPLKDADCERDVSLGMNGGSEDKSTKDEDFLRVAQANREDPNAEFEWDSNPEIDDNVSEASSLSLSGSSSGNSSASGDAVLLAPEEQARILMREGIDDEPSAKNALRTENEARDEQFVKPDVTITSEMTVKPLGQVVNILNNIVVVKGFTSGEFNIIKAGAVLCLEDRTVIGSVSEPLGRVHEPHYSVGFSLASEIEEFAITKGTKIFFVQELSEFLFTQNLKFKGTDASNIHDEEIAAEEQEFSDDEKEAEHKRQKKTSKKGASTRQSRNKFPSQHNTGMPRFDNTQSHDVSLNYSDNDDADMYTPLSRPDNFRELSGFRQPPIEEIRRNRRLDRGRTSRGRADRARGARGRGQQHGRSDRGGKFSNTFRGRQGSERSGGHSPAPRINTRHVNLNGNVRAGSKQSSPPQYDPGSPAEGITMPPRPQHAPSPATPGHFSFPMPSQTFNIPRNFSSTNPAIPSPYHSFPPSPATPGGSIPAGAHINPAFFQHQPPSNTQTPDYMSRWQPPSQPNPSPHLPSWPNLYPQGNMQYASQNPPPSGDAVLDILRRLQPGAGSPR